jgi:hypothetical protein
LELEKEIRVLDEKLLNLKREVLFEAGEILELEN